MARFNAVLEDVSGDLQEAVLAPRSFFQIEAYDVPQVARLPPSGHGVFTGHTFEGGADQGRDKLLEKLFVSFHAWYATPIRH